MSAVCSIRPPPLTSANMRAPLSPPAPISSAAAAARPTAHIAEMRYALDNPGDLTRPLPVVRIVKQKTRETAVADPPTQLAQNLAAQPFRRHRGDESAERRCRAAPARRCANAEGGGRQSAQYRRQPPGAHAHERLGCGLPRAERCWPGNRPALSRPAAATCSVSKGICWRRMRWASATSLLSWVIRRASAISPRPPTAMTSCPPV